MAGTTVKTITSVEMVDTKKFKSLLAKRRQDLLDIVDSSRHAAEPVELDQTKVGRLSRMDSLQSQAMSVAANQRIDQELKNIQSAIKRIDSGHYGYCEECGEEIASARLEIDPAAELCIKCATALEELNG